MKENSVIKLGYRPADVVQAFGSKALYHACLKAGWLTPIIRKHKLTLFAQEDVLAFYKRIAAGEMPFQTEAA